MANILDLFKDIKFVIGTISTLMIILSAFRYEIIHDDGNYDIDDNGNSNEDSGTTVDKTVLDALSKFDRNVRHLLIKGKEASKYDFMNVLPDFKEAIDKATTLLNQLQKLNLSTNYNCKDNRRNKDYYKGKKNKKGSDRTFSFSLRLGSSIYKVSLYWPKLVRLFLPDDSD